jgi:Domain of unknown function (DUF4129)
VTARSQRLRSTLRGVPVAALLLGLLVLVALASRSGHHRGSVPTVPGPPASFLDYAFTAGLVVAAVALLLALRHARVRKPRQLRSNWYVLGMILVVAVAALTSAFVARHLHLIHHPGQLGGGAQAAGGAARRLPPDRAGSERHLHLRWEAGAISLALLGVAAVSIVLVRRRRSAGELDAEPDALPEALTAAFDESLDDLRREQDARRAVIAAYARAERVLAEHGLARRPAEAPLEYLSRVLLGLRVRAGAVLELTELFERAKFSTHHIDRAMKEDAIDSLAAVRDDLRAAGA